MLIRLWSMWQWNYPACICAVLAVAYLPICQTRPAISLYWRHKAPACPLSYPISHQPFTLGWGISSGKRLEWDSLIWSWFSRDFPGICVWWCVGFSLCHPLYLNDWGDFKWWLNPSWPFVKTCFKWRKILIQCCTTKEKQQHDTLVCSDYTTTNGQMR